jgi:hypothetical protein
MAALYAEGVPILEIAQAYGMSQEWAMKVIQTQLGLEAVRAVQEKYRVGQTPACDMCGEPIGDDQADIVNGQPVHSTCLFDSDYDVFSEAEIEDRLMR